MKNSIFILIGIIIGSVVTAQQDSTNFELDTLITNKKMIIATKLAAPFVFKNDAGELEGISIALWEQIAQELDLEFEYKLMDLEQLLENTRDGKVDLAVAATTINREREMFLDFSQPYFITGLGIATKESGNKVLQTLQRFFSWDFFKAIGGLAVIILIFGGLAWLFERRYNKEEFGGKWYKGIGAGFWWSAVTMTTVGYGDKSPRSPGGRIIALIWMFMSLIIISGFTAAITSSLTINQLSTYQIQSPGDLYKARVGTLRKSVGQQYLLEKGIAHENFSDIKNALEELAAGNLDAVVYDQPIIRYILKNEMVNSQINILPHNIQNSYYGFAFTNGSPLREEINLKLLEVISRPTWREVLHQYTGEMH